MLPAIVFRNIRYSKLEISRCCHRWVIFEALKICRGLAKEMRLENKNKYWKKNNGKTWWILLFTYLNVVAVVHILFTSSVLDFSGDCYFQYLTFIFKLLLSHQSKKLKTSDNWICQDLKTFKQKPLQLCKFSFSTKA